MGANAGIPPRSLMFRQAIRLIIRLAVRGRMAITPPTCYLEDMKRVELLSRLRDSVDAVRAEGATGLYIYGSRARGDHRPDSDLDVFVDYDPGKKFSLIDLAGIYNVLTERLGLEISITTRDALHPKLREQIEREAVRIV